MGVDWIYTSGNGNGTPSVVPSSSSFFPFFPLLFRFLLLFLFLLSFLPLPSSVPFYYCFLIFILFA
jgi:hypothetical protein